MKILIVMPGLDSRIGGMERFVIEFATRMSRKKHEMTILTSKHKDAIDVPGVRIIREKILYPGKFNKFVKYLHLSYVASRHLKKNAYDLVLAMGPSGVLLKDFVWRASGGPAPLVRELRGSEEKGIFSRIMTDLDLWTYEQLERSSIRKARFHMYPSSEMKSLYEKTYGFKSMHYFIPCSGIGLNEGKGSVLDWDRIHGLKILIVGGLSQELKGSKVIQKALSQMDLSDISLVVTGDINVRLGKDISKHAISVGKVESGRMADIYRNCDLMIYPSITEGFPNTVLEAANYGLPMITSDLEGIREYFEDNREILLVRKNDPDDLAEKIGRLTKSSSLRRQLSSNVKIRASKLEYDHLVEEFIRSVKDGKSRNLLER